MLTSPHDFFELHGFAYADIFDGMEHAWETLDRLPDYLDAHDDWRVLGDVAPGAVIKGNVFIGRGTYSAALWLRAAGPIPRPSGFGRAPPLRAKA